MVGNAKQKIGVTLELAVSKVINSAHGIPHRVSLALLLTRNEFECPLSKSRRSISQPFDDLRDEVNAVLVKLHIYSIREQPIPTHSSPFGNAPPSPPVHTNV